MPVYFTVGFVYFCSACNQEIVNESIVLDHLQHNHEVLVKLPQ